MQLWSSSTNYPISFATTASIPTDFKMAVAAPHAGYCDQVKSSSVPSTVHPMTRFVGKVALVTGAASGIGAAVSQRLTDEGATVVGCDLNDVSNGIVCDVTDEQSCAAAVAEVVERHGALDVLANVAGIAIAGAVVDLEPDHWRRVIEVNLTGTFLMSHCALPALLRSKGVIVNMASVAGIRATAYNAAYCASKGGVIMLTKSMAIELAKTGVRVNAVCPASVDTPFLRGFEIPEDADLSLLARSISPTGRLIQPAEVAAAVAYLASEEAANISGTTLTIDGAASA
jgi:NAD(P)-dependent dehydrogenase (short-subunit alcohol dehydrogenase family)